MPYLSESQNRPESGYACSGAHLIMKRFLSLFFACMIFPFSLLQAQSLVAPEQFLGYKPGAKFTPHHMLTAYFREMARMAPDKVTLIPYGKTHAGRELVVAAVSSPANMGRLEDIRKNSLRMAGILLDQPSDANMPAIVWLSYNVHGNEASSSEVAIELLHQLVSGNDARVARWLEQVVVIIDPCLNPDGRERYVQWYNQQTGKRPQADPQSREHDEPWPGGRTNHYYFDLNRDWAWQTQPETKQRVRLYHQWMPSIHGDYHEQYPESPYYFAPAAEPFHEAITDWQRRFQFSLGKNHAKYFDANGWLYFTREYFDLFYPSYGDTYPIFNGSIGMTFEQAGHGLAGRAIALRSGDTLTLADRMAHHLATSLSTIEVVASNSKKVNEEFRQYFDDSRKNGSGAYASYIISGANQRKIADLLSLLRDNQINWGYVKSGTALKGYNYFTGKEEAYSTQALDIVVHTQQPKANLVRVLFEPLSKLSDSATYDITAWALPYAYGIQAYAVKEKIAAAPLAIDPPVFPELKSEYAYLLAYNAFRDGRMLAALLSEGFRVRITEKDIVYEGKKFSKGTLVVLRKENESRMDKLRSVLMRHSANVTPVQTGFMDSGLDFGSDKLRFIRSPRVAILSGEEAYAENMGEIWHLFDQELDYQVSLLNSQSIGRFNLSNYDVLIVPEGQYKFISDKEISADIKTWVRQGGRLVVLGQAVAQMASSEWGIKLKKQDAEKQDEKSTGEYADLRKYENRDRDQLSQYIPGAIYRVELDNSHPLCFGYGSAYYTLKQNGNLIEFMKDGWNVGVIKKEKQVSGFVGNKLKEQLKDGTVLAVQPMGRGTIVYFADNPLFRSFWQNGKLLFVNSVFLAGQ